MSLTRVRATDFIQATRGGSRAALVRCSDGNFYVIKSPNNAQARDVLGSEYLYTRFGEMIGAQVQPQAAVEVGDDIIEAVIAAADVKNESTNVIRMLTSIYRPSSDIGPYYGSLCPVNPIKDGVYDFVPPSFRDRLHHPERIGAILALDSWLLQMDSRQIIYYLRGSQLHWSAIDHGYTSFMTLANKSEEWSWKCGNSLTHPVFSDHDDTVFPAIEAAAAKIAAIRPATIVSVMQSCPDQWKPNSAYNAYVQTLAAITLRRSSIMITKSAMAAYNDNERNACRDEKAKPRAKQGKILTRAPRARKANPANPAIPAPGTYQGPTNPILPGARLVAWADPDQ